MRIMYTGDEGLITGCPRFRRKITQVRAFGPGSHKVYDTLMAVREREGADIAVFISLEEPTRGMKSDAASADFYESPNGKKFPRVQLLTVEGLLNKTERAEHPDYEPDLNFKKAKRESSGEQSKLL